MITPVNPRFYSLAPTGMGYGFFEEKKSRWGAFYFALSSLGLGFPQQTASFLLVRPAATSPSQCYIGSEHLAVVLVEDDASQP